MCRAHTVYCITLREKANSNLKLMKLNSIKKFPFYPFLLPAFFVLHVSNKYYLLLPVQPIIEFFLYYALLAALLLVAGKLLFKSLVKAGVWTTSLLMIFFFFGGIHDFLKSTPFTHFISSYTFLLFFLPVSMLIFSVYIKKKKGTFEKTHNYFTILFTVLVSLEGVFLLQKMITNDQQNNIAHHNNDVIKSKLTCDTCNRPDIFFIVFDEYASSLSLQRYFGFDNSYLDSSLKKHNYYIAKKAKSNYNLTALSISSTFNLQYFNLPLENKVASFVTLEQGWYALKNSRLPQVLAQSGYAIHNFGLCDFNNYPVHTSCFNNEDAPRILYEETLWGRIARDILWNTQRLNLTFLKKKQYQENKQKQSSFIERNQKNWQLILQELKTQNDQPKFVFGHIMMPHKPFYIDRKGKWTTDFSTIAKDNNNPGPYLEQLMYSNSWIDSILQVSNLNFTRPRVVIVEGDHGFRDFPYKPGYRDKHFMNLNTYFFSDKDYSRLYDSISPVNTFRVVLNKYFNTQLDLLKDSTIFLR